MDKLLFPAALASGEMSSSLSVCLTASTVEALVGFSGGLSALVVTDGGHFILVVRLMTPEKPPFLLGLHLSSFYLLEYQFPFYNQAIRMAQYFADRCYQVFSRPWL